MIDKSG